VKPTVEINVFGKEYSLIPTFDLYSKIEKGTGMGLFSIVGHPESVTLEWLKVVLKIVVGDDLKDKSDDDLKALIMEDYVHISNQLTSLVVIGFINPNLEVKKIKQSQKKN